MFVWPLAVGSILVAEQHLARSVKKYVSDAKARLLIVGSNRR